MGVYGDSNEGVCIDPIDEAYGDFIEGVYGDCFKEVHEDSFQGVYEVFNEGVYEDSIEGFYGHSLWTRDFLDIHLIYIETHWTSFLSIRRLTTLPAREFLNLQFVYGVENVWTSASLCRLPS